MRYQIACLAVLLVLTLSLSLAAEEAKPAGPKSPAAQGAIAKHDKVLADAARAYQQAKAKADQDLVAELKKVQADVMKTGGAPALAEAQAIQKEIDALGKPDAPAASSNGSPVGTWRIRFHDGQTRDYIFAKDGSVQMRDNGKTTPAGQLSRVEGRTGFVDQAYKKMRIVYVANDQMFFENFNGPRVEATPESVASGPMVK